MAATDSTSPKFIVMSDFDGTISLDDTGNILTDASMGKERREAIDNEYMEGKISFRELQIQEWSGVNLTWETAVELLKDSTIDPHFAGVVDWCIAHKIPLGIVSAGLDKLIDLHFEHSLTKEQLEYMEIFSNKLIVVGDKWSIRFADDSELGHDKAASIKKVADRYEVAPKVVFIGDGISDVASAKEADYLFAKRGLDLDNWCEKNGVKRDPFDDFAYITKRLEEISAVL
ncbi:hypothetical protein DL89DRAFT_269555 [Linderina pennispora]|uniref:HAD-like protein n=1 Tax=Linderina pennispora TaxID=61395 RepID=A0A1Y1W0R9_9FUNG|nr:uncharacterized protein DL89DRAFT_269555 [Linderina pennispora]ORX67129.1 hypothetical protein DL89DRAFT_269555 [Linderina pennispora]